MRSFNYFIVIFVSFNGILCRDEEKIMKSCFSYLLLLAACYWPHEVYEPCFGGCAEVSCDNPRNHLRPCYPYCEPGCICEEPYVRDDRTHQCVLPQDCSPTQMGIPVPSKRSGGGATSKPAPPKYEPRPPRLGAHTKRDMADNMEREVPPPLPPSPGVHDDWQNPKRAEMSRMGNYFNIVIAPPPIKALQPRKLIQNDQFRSNSKRSQR